MDDDNRLLVQMTPGRYRYADEGEVFPTPNQSPDLLPGLPDPIPIGESIVKNRRWSFDKRVQETHSAAFEVLLHSRIPRPQKAEGDGIVICGGGRYWPMVYVAVQMIRKFSNLPIQIWYRGDAEPIGDELNELPGISFHNACNFPARILRGWECKTVALINCGFERVFYLDADAYPIADFQKLFDYSKQAPFIFWEDLHSNERRINWQACGMTGPNGAPPIQGGHLLVHRSEWWRELVLSHWLNMHSDFYYSLYYGDQDSWRVVLAATGLRFRSLGMVEWSHPAYLCKLPGDRTPAIVHRAQGKTWDKGRFGTSYNLPAEAEVKSLYDDFMIGKGPAEKVFNRIYKNEIWGCGDRSGFGSTLEESQPFVDLFNGMAKVADWKYAVDLGCGDGEVLRRLNVAVIGVDVYGEHLQRLSKETPPNCYLQLDIDNDRDKLPEARVAIIRDVLQHWPNNLVEEWLSWARSSRKWEWLIVSNDCENADERDCILGGFRPLSAGVGPLAGFDLSLVLRHNHKAVYLMKCGGRFER